MSEWVYYRDGKWDGLPEVGVVCDLSCCPGGAWISKGVSHMGGGVWVRGDDGIERTATNDFEVYAWRFHEEDRPAPVPVPEGGAK